MEGLGEEIFCPPERNFSEISVGIFAEKSSDFVQERQPFRISWPTRSRISTGETIIGFFGCFYFTTPTHLGRNVKWANETNETDFRGVSHRVSFALVFD